MCILSSHDHASESQTSINKEMFQFQSLGCADTKECDETRTAVSFGHLIWLIAMYRIWDTEST